MLTIKHIAFRYCLILVVLGLMSCKNNAQSDVPDYPVFLDVNISKEDPGFLPDHGFQTRTYTKKIKDTDQLGYAGLLVWVNTLNEYRAADLACPHCLRRDQSVTVDGFFADCPICGERFELNTEGFPKRGITDQPLKHYSVMLVNEGPYKVLRVRN